MTEEDSTPFHSHSFLRQFGATMMKNIHQKRRAPVTLCCEMCIPMLVVAFTTLIWILSEPEDHPGEIFWEKLEDASLFSQMLCYNGTESLPLISSCSTLLASTGLPESLLKCEGKEMGLPIDNLCGVFLGFNELFNLFTPKNMQQTYTLDEMILLQFYVRVLLGDKRPPPFSGVRALRLSGKLYFLAEDPANIPVVNKLISYLNQTSLLFKYVAGTVFTSTAEAEAELIARRNLDRVWGLVQVNKMDANNFDVTLRLNRTAVGPTQQEMVVNRYYTGGLGSSDSDTGGLHYCNYLGSGFVTLQNEISKFFFQDILGETLPSPAVSTPMGFIAWTEDIFLEMARTEAAMYMVMSFLYPVAQLAGRIVAEKEQRIREGMKIMGLGTGSFYMSWVCTYSLMGIITCVGCCLIMRLTYLVRSDEIVVFLIFFLFTTSNISLAGLLSTFFSKARPATLVSPLMYFVLALPMYAISAVPPSVEIFFYFLSPSAFSGAMNLLFLYEQSSGLGWKQLVDSRDNVNMLTIMIMLAADTVIYSLLTLYFDCVLPSEWGAKKHPLFCIIEPYKWMRSKMGNQAVDEDVFEDGRDPNGVYEKIEDSPKNPVTVVLHNLHKEFARGDETFVAVSNLNLTFREGGISVLLGHNGAGKTTTLNLITGMLEPDHGDCTVYGKSVRRELSTVRKAIGFCPQHNILWAELTCAEHLRFYGALKGLKGEELDNNVDEMLRAVDLFEKKDSLSSQLSGGQKRKLSVAIAFVGRSKLVFLDEPTAGMDVAARRHTWDLLKRMVQGRTIILTTHYMDEADLLGHSVAIMSRGRLKCHGSSMFLKSRLGVGYSITMSVDPQTDPTPIANLITSSIRQAQELPSGAGEVSFRLPMDTVPHFPDLLSSLEKNGEAIGVKGTSLNVTTLEEVFLRIACDDDESKKAHNKEVNPQKSDLWSLQLSLTPPKGWALFTTQMKSLLTKRFHSSRRDTRTQCIQIVAPVVCVLLAMLLTLINYDPRPPILIDEDMYQVPVEYMSGNCPLAGRGDIWHSSCTHKDFSSQARNGSHFAKLIVDEYDNHDKEHFVAFYCNTPVPGASSNKTVLLHNTSATHSLPETLNAYFRAHLPSPATQTMKISSYPLPVTDLQNEFLDGIKALLIGLMLVIPFTIIPSTFVAWIVKESESKAKHLQTVSGMNFSLYWLSNLLFDLMSFLITEILVIIVFFCFSRDEYVGNGEVFAATFLLFLLYGFAGIASSYAISFIFDDHASAQNAVMLYNFLAGFICVMLIFMMEMFDSTENIAKVLKWFFRVIPSFCLGEGVVRLAARKVMAEMAKGPFDMDITGYSMIFMALAFPLFMSIAILIDHPKRRMQSQKLFHKPDEMPPPIEGEDEDVATERRQIEGNDSSRDSDYVKVKHFCKVYSNGKVAVKNLSFGVKKGEVFGFLGTNGAGKTTTISILCGEQLPTHGRGFVVGYDVVDEGYMAQRSIGYCPQFDALFDLLTVKEHLELYAGLRGVPASSTDFIVEELMRVCELTQYTNTVASNLSGGNRRKLSVAIAMIGTPKVIFLDEPSAGMDPMARRGLWEVINSISSHCSIVLTTHHLEEVEALAHRVAIMVDGELKCIGDKTHLKMKYGSGFEMTLRIDNEDKYEGIATFIGENFPDAILNEYRSLKFSYALSSTTRLSEVFRVIEEFKIQLGITDYGISQTSIEQVFLRISEAAEMLQEAVERGDVGEEELSVINRQVSVTWDHQASIIRQSSTSHEIHPTNSPVQ